MLLQQLPSERLDEIIADKDMMARIDHVWKMFQDYMAQPMRSDIPSVSYFSMEYGLCNCLKIYSGGLGVLAGDYIKEASDSRVDMTAVGFLYRYGYFTPDSQRRRPADSQLRASELQPAPHRAGA